MSMWYKSAVASTHIYYTHHRRYTINPGLLTSPTSSKCSMQMLTLCALALCLAALCAADHDLPENVAYRPGQCLSGDRHKELACPEPEGPEYQACHQWRDAACCTANFTSQLAVANVTNIDGFHWTRCGAQSPACQQFFVRIECFYRCSPHVAHWALEPFDSAFANMPLCGQFCDEWFEACADDMTCATNWITDWEFINGVNHCRNRSESACRSYREIYGNAVGLCQTLWGQSFLYSNDSQTAEDRECMIPYWPVEEENPNLVAVRNIFGEEVDTVTPVPCSALGHGRGGGALVLFLVAVLAAWLGGRGQ